MTEPLRVMSFNVRYGLAKDGDNDWGHRKPLVIDTIEAFGPDLLGVQECLPFQADAIREQLAGHGFVGVGRDDGEQQGEMTAVFFRQDRFELIDSGHFWLSESPDRPGSVSWDSSMTRMASWGRLRDRDARRELVFANTHWDHVGKQARLESALLVRRKLFTIAGDSAIMLVGDFNTTEDDPPYVALVGRDPNGKRLFRDAYRAVHPQRTDQERTYHAFEGRRDGNRIDWILHTEHLTAADAAIDTTHRDGHYPSDHYPVTAVLQWNE